VKPNAKIKELAFRNLKEIKFEEFRAFSGTMMMLFLVWIFIIMKFLLLVVLMD